MIFHGALARDSVSQNYLNFWNEYPLTQSVCDVEVANIVRRGSGDEMHNQTQDHVKGMIIMVISVMLLPLMDAVGKWLAMEDQMPPASVTFMRFLIQFLITLAILLWMGGLPALSSRNLGGNLIRGVLMGFGSLCFFTAIKYMPLADAMAVFFAEPLILTLLSAVFLKETVGWRRLSAVTVGLIGTVIVIQPSWEIFGPISLLPLITAFLFAVYLILNRLYGHTEEPMVMQLYAGVGGLLVAGVVMLIAPRFGVADMSFALPSGLTPWLLLLVMGALATVGHLLVVHAFRRAPASLLAPFQYLEIVMAVLVGLLIFDDFPTPSKWLGICIIIGSGIYVFMRERRAKVTIEVKVAP